MAKEDTNRSLVTKAQHGDRDAFNRLVESHQARVAAFVAARAKLYIGPPIETEEVLQETFVRAYESMAHFDWKGEDAFFKWLCGIAKHVLLQAVDRHRNCQPLQAAEEIPGSSTSPSKHLRREERWGRLQSAMDELPDEYRKVIRMARIDGLPIREIARRLNRSPNAVSHLIARALDRLKARFGDTESLHLPEEHMTERRVINEGENDDD